MLLNKLSHCRSEMISFQIKGGKTVLVVLLSARWRQMLCK